MAAAKVPHFAIQPTGVYRLELCKQRREDEYCNDATPECGVSAHGFNIKLAWVIIGWEIQRSFVEHKSVAKFKIDINHMQNVDKSGG